jgi:hypothetical protein
LLFAIDRIDIRGQHKTLLMEALVAMADASLSLIRRFDLALFSSTSLPGLTAAWIYWRASGGMRCQFLDVAGEVAITDQVKRLCAGKQVLRLQAGLPSCFSEALEGAGVHDLVGDSKSIILKSWELGFGSSPLPVFLLFLDEAARWHFTMPDSRAFTLGVRTEVLGKPFAEACRYMDSLALPQNFHRVLDKGRQLTSFVDTLARRGANKGSKKKLGSSTGLVINCTYFVDEVALQMASENELLVLWSYDPRDRTLLVELRSLVVDSAAIARRFGAIGGHPRIASFRFCGSVNELLSAPQWASNP